LDLCCTDISDEGLQHLAQLQGLQYSGITLDLRDSRVTVAGVADFLKSMPEPASSLEAWLHVNEGSVSHQTMFFGGSPITDEKIECFRGLTGFDQVDLSKTLITDAGLEVVASFVHLVHLNISGTQITDSGLEHLKGLADLQSLDLRDTCVTDEGVNRLQQAMPSCRIDM
jgi:hypothetical protein